MTGEMTGIPTTEIRRAEAMLTPVLEAMTKARHEIKSHESDLLAAGVTKDQVEMASNLASDRVKKEFEEHEKQDPLNLLAKAATSTAETDDEQLTATHTAANTEINRNAWKEMAGKLRMTAEAHREYFVDPSNLSDLLHNQSRMGYSKKPTIRSYDALGKVSTVFAVLERVWQENGNSMKVGEAHMLRTLRALGALRDDQDLTFLRALPDSHDAYQRGEPIRASVGADNLPTNIPGVKLWVSLRPDDYWVAARLNDEALKKAVDFPSR